MDRKNRNLSYFHISAREIILLVVTFILFLLHQNYSSTVCPQIEQQRRFSKVSRPYHENITFENSRRWKPRGFTPPNYWRKEAIPLILESSLRKSGNCCGDFYQAGVYTGGSMRAVKESFSAANIVIRKAYGLDSFQGLSAEKEGVFHPRGFFEGSYNAAEALEIYDYKELCVAIGKFINEDVNFPTMDVDFVRGFFNESLSKTLAAERKMHYAIYIDIDVDLYLPSIQILDFLFCHNLAVPGTVIGYDDWLSGTQHGGEQVAHQHITHKYGIKWETGPIVKNYAIFRVESISNQTAQCGGF